MTRRYVVFIDENGSCYITTEFNGDQEEFLKYRSMDSCDKNWNEILSEFDNVKTIDEFKKANEVAQSYYHSFLGKQEPLPIEKVKFVGDVQNDEVYIIKNGKSHILVQAEYQIGNNVKWIEYNKDTPIDKKGIINDIILNEQMTKFLYQVDTTPFWLRQEYISIDEEAE